MYFYGFTSLDDQKQIPVILPVMTHDYTFKQPVFGGEVSVHSNITSLSRESAFYSPITADGHRHQSVRARPPPTPRFKTLNNCLLRGFPGVYSRASSEVTWRRSVIDSYGQIFTPFASLRGDFANIQVDNQTRASPTT